MRKPFKRKGTRKLTNHSNKAAVSKSREVAQTPIYVVTHFFLKSRFTHNFSDH